MRLPPRKVPQFSESVLKDTFWSMDSPLLDAYSSETEGLVGLITGTVIGAGEWSLAVTILMGYTRFHRYKVGFKSTRYEIKK